MLAPVVCCPHRMAKTFDTISEAKDTNYLFLFAQRTLALQHEPPTPPPLNVLGLLCQTIKAMVELGVWLWEKCNKYAPAPEVGMQTACALACVRFPAGPKREAMALLEQSLRRAGVEEATAVASVLCAYCKPQQEIAKLAEKITEYIINHQDDAAQEDRWRTIMKREMTNNFRKVKEVHEKVETEMQEQKEAIAKQHKDMQVLFEKVLLKLDQPLQG